MDVIKVTQNKNKAASIALRWQIFVCEQDVLPSEEVDDDDVKLPFYEAWENGQLFGTARVRFIDGGRTAKIERFGVILEARGKGVGRLILDKILADLREQGIAKATLEAQVQALPFYEKSGFAAYGEEFMDARIPHKKMEIHLNS